MKNHTTFVRMRSGDHLGDAKMSKKGPRSVEFNFFINCERHKRFSQNEEPDERTSFFLLRFYLCFDYCCLQISLVLRVVFPGISLALSFHFDAHTHTHIILN